MDYEIQAYAQADYLQDRLKDLKKKYGGKNHTAYENIPHFFDRFAGMEVINPDWYICLERNSRYFKTVAVRRTMNGSCLNLRHIIRRRNTNTSS